MPCLNRVGSTSVILQAPLAGIRLEAGCSSCAAARLVFFSGTLDNVAVTLRCLDAVPTVPGVRAVLSEAFEITPGGLTFPPGRRAHLAIDYDASIVAHPDRVRVFARQGQPDDWAPLPADDHGIDATSGRLLHVALRGVVAGGRYVVVEMA